MQEQTGILMKIAADLFFVEREDKIQLPCKARGVFRQDGTAPRAGDKVRFRTAEHGGEGVLTEVLPRKNSLLRPPLANLDKLFLLCSTAQPSPNLFLLDKLITACEYKGIEPIVVITKCDLRDPDSVARIYEKSGFRVFTVSPETEEPIRQLRSCLQGSVSAFVGNSGVGKSTLLNRIAPELQAKTGEISRKLGRGRHTTRQVELFRLDDLSCYVADTPGFGTMELWQYEPIGKDELQYAFREFAPYLEHCRYHDCAHLAEPGCAVLEAVKQGEIPQERHGSYRELYALASQHKPWEEKTRK